MNYLNFNRTFVRKMAMLLALVFAACSENNDVAGGTVEETGVTATVQVVGHAMRVSYKQSSDSTLISSNLWDGYMVRMTELDSVTLDTTENIYYSSYTDSSGMFAFDSVLLSSPYVLLELSPLRGVNWWEPEEDFDWMYYYSGKSIPYRTVVNLREVQDVAINVMSSLEAYRLLYLVKQGMSFDAAKQQADRDVMDAFGFYDTPFRYGGYVYFSSSADMDAVYFVSVFTESSDKCINQQSVEVFAMNGSFVDAPDSVKQACKESMGPSLFYEQYLKDEERTMYGNFLSSLYGLGKCTDEKEGDSLEIEFLGPELILKVKCMSGDWNASAYRTMDGEISREEGVMTDVRDGKTYKTVTYSFNGITQTWMMENLAYSTETVKPVLDSASVNELKASRESRIQGEFRVQGASGEDSLNWRSMIRNGCWYCTFDSSYWDSYVEYKWYEAMGLDSASVPMDSGKVDIEKVVAIVDSVERVNGYYQGLCPDGWRLPKVDDWVQLLKQGIRMQGFIVGEDWMGGTLSFPDIGFGPISTEYFVISPDGANGGNKFAEGIVFGVEFISNLKVFWNGRSRLTVNEMMSVRCVKN
jgi:uncharacterized protein (TIGR02145 family)